MLWRIVVLQKASLRSERACGVKKKERKRKHPNNGRRNVPIGWWWRWWWRWWWVGGGGGGEAGGGVGGVGVMWADREHLEDASKRRMVGASEHLNTR